MRKRPSHGPAGSGHLPAAPCPAAPRSGLLEEWPLSTSPSFCIVAHLQEGAVFGGRLGCHQPPLTMGPGTGRRVHWALWASVSLSPQGLPGAAPALGCRRRAQSAGWRATSPRLVPWPRSSLSRQLPSRQPAGVCAATIPWTASTAQQSPAVFTQHSAPSVCAADERVFLDDGRFFTSFVM